MSDGFEATFAVGVDRATAWTRLVEAGPAKNGHVFVPGFEDTVTIAGCDTKERLAGTKDNAPCQGTHIVVTMEDDDAGTRVRVAQSRFGEWFDRMGEVLAIGWRHIVADLQTQLATGTHGQRHMRQWGNFGAVTRTVDGAVLVTDVAEDGLAARIGLEDGDLLVALAGAPVSNLDDLTTILRSHAAGYIPSLTAEWIRNGRRW